MVTGRAEVSSRQAVRYRIIRQKRGQELSRGQELATRQKQDQGSGQKQAGSAMREQAE